jgi:hypothetical protein
MLTQDTCSIGALAQLFRKMRLKLLKKSVHEFSAKGFVQNVM